MAQVEETVGSDLEPPLLASRRQFPRNAAAQWFPQWFSWLRLGFLCLGLCLGLSRLWKLGALSSSHLSSDPSPLASATLASSSLLPKVAVVPYGVLGVQLDMSHHVVPAAREPAADTVVVDPAGLRFIQDLGPAGAGGASGAIYSWLKIGLDAHFPHDVRQALRQEGDAKIHTYGQKHVIHVVGPDLGVMSMSTPATRASAVDKLTVAYRHILEEFLTSESPRLRLLPVSGGIFAGPFQKDLPAMTFTSLDGAFRSLPPASQRRLLRTETKISLCIFDQRELEEFQALCPTCAPREG